MKALRKGVSNPLVRDWQRFLHEQNVLASDPSGSFDIATEQATMAFQAANNLDPDGVAGDFTIGIGMKKGFKLLKQALRQGVQNELVQKWQQFLSEKRMLTGTITNVYDQRVAEATKAFQQQNGLFADGEAGNMTFATAMLQGFKMPDSVLNNAATTFAFPAKPSFSALGVTGTKRLFGDFAYEPDPTTSEPDGIRILGGWREQNIVKARIPQTLGIKGALASGNVFFNKVGEAQLKKLWQDWENAGLLVHILTFDGAFNPRFQRSTKKPKPHWTKRPLSNHAWGTAFDINAGWNPLGKETASFGKKGCVWELVRLAHENGFYWGGHFEGRMDGMHFELAKIIS
jgi:peptidoglycan hydrolase-like protein with peptidoglycan-binding domain